MDDVEDAATAAALALAPATPAPAGPGLTEEGAFELILQVAHALFVSGRLDESAAMTVSCLAQHKERGLVPSQTAALRHMRAHVALARGNLREAAEAARLVATTHAHSPEAWNPRLQKPTLGYTLCFTNTPPRSAP
jgi:hypothetical protein